MKTNVLYVLILGLIAFQALMLYWKYEASQVKVKA